MVMFIINLFLLLLQAIQISSDYTVLTIPLIHDETNNGNVSLTSEVSLKYSTLLQGNWQKIIVVELQKKRIDEEGHIKVIDHISSLLRNLGFHESVIGGSRLVSDDERKGGVGTTAQHVVKKLLKLAAIHSNTNTNKDYSSLFANLQYLKSGSSGDDNDDDNMNSYPDMGKGSKEVSGTGTNSVDSGKIW